MYQFQRSKFNWKRIKVNIINTFYSSFNHLQKAIRYKPDIRLSGTLLILSEGL